MLGDTDREVVDTKVSSAVDRINKFVALKPVRFQHPPFLRVFPHFSGDKSYFLTSRAFCWRPFRLLGRVWFFFQRSGGPELHGDIRFCFAQPDRWIGD